MEGRELAGDPHLTRRLLPADRTRGAPDEEVEAAAKSVLQRPQPARRGLQTVCHAGTITPVSMGVKEGFPSWRALLPSFFIHRHLTPSSIGHSLILTSKVIDLRD